MSKMKVNRIENTSTASGGLDVDTSGKVRITTLADSAGNNDSTPAEIASGRAKAWVNFNGTGTVAVRASYNVSSITDIATGRFSVHFTTPFASVNYVAAGTAGNLTGTTATGRDLSRDGEWTTGIAYFRNVQSPSTAADDNYVGLMFIGA